MTIIVFLLSLLLLFLDPGSEIRDPEWVKIGIRNKHPESAALTARFKTSRSLMTFTYECRAVLEQCKESALSRLEEIHNQRELAVMETLEDIDLAQVP
jgi:hypothetical protein